MLLTLPMSAVMSFQSGTLVLLTISSCHTRSALSREQERIAKAEAARRETERILREQQAEVDAKKADMVKRDIQREKVGASTPKCEHALSQGMLL